jgi:hypothetical protein
MSKTPTLTIAIDGGIIARPDALFAGPRDATSQQGLIRMWSDAGGQQEKNILYTLAQRALLEMEDRDLSIDRYASGTIIEATYGDLEVSMPEGAVLFLAEGNRVGLHVHEGINVLRMLTAFHRYATRMIRLDV